MGEDGGTDVQTWERDLYELGSYLQETGERGTQPPSLTSLAAHFSSSAPARVHAGSTLK